MLDAALVYEPERFELAQVLLEGTFSTAVSVTKDILHVDRSKPADFDQSLLLFLVEPGTKIAKPIGAAVAAAVITGSVGYPAAQPANTLAGPLSCCYQNGGITLSAGIPRPASGDSARCTLVRSTIL